MTTWTHLDRQLEETDDVVEDGEEEDDDDEEPSFTRVQGLKWNNCLTIFKHYLFTLFRKSISVAYLSTATATTVYTLGMEIVTGPI